WRAQPPRGRSRVLPRRPPWAEYDGGRDGKGRGSRRGRGPSAAVSVADASGADAGAGVPDDRLHAVLRHQLELLELAHSPLLVRRERRRSTQRLQLALVAL